MMKKVILLIAGLTLASGVAQAHGDEGHHMDGHMSDKMTHNPCSMKPMNPCGMQKDSFMKKNVIDGYDVSFHIVEAPKGMEHGGSHHLMVKVEKDNKLVSLKAINSKVTHPNEQSESKMMMKMGDWYMVSYNLAHPGEHKVMVLFKTSDGQKHFGGTVYSSHP